MYGIHKPWILFHPTKLFKKGAVSTTSPGVGAFSLSQDWVHRGSLKPIDVKSTAPAFDSAETDESSTSLISKSR